eukprot:1005882-Rhodomonas_salina.6
MQRQQDTESVLSLSDLGRGLGVLEVALHDEVAPEHELAGRLAVGWHRLHRLAVQHLEILQRVRVDALPRAQPSLPATE